MRTSPLVQFTLNGLKHCHMPERGLWSFKYHLDGRQPPNEARPSYDVFYSLNVLLGLSKTVEAARAAFGVAPDGMFQHVASRLTGAGARRYAYGMALWAAAELETMVPDDIVERIRSMTAAPNAMEPWTAQDVGMILSGAVAQSRRSASWAKLARDARNHILARLSCESGLFRDCAIGGRRFFASFATEVYCALALYQYDELFGDPLSATAADTCVRKLISLQGPQGEWPWFYHAASGRVVDFYEVYSVHQHGMAPALLKHAIRRRVAGAKEALVKGFRWVLGDNELGVSMLRPEISVIARSQARKGWASRRDVRLARACFNAMTGRSAKLIGWPREITITPEVRSYELGWTLWSFGDDSDFPELTHHPAFTIAGVARRRAESMTFSMD
jgi:hypothetical protein